MFPLDHELVFATSTAFRTDAREPPTLSEARARRRRVMATVTIGTAVNSALLTTTAVTVPAVICLVIKSPAGARDHARREVISQTSGSRALAQDGSWTSSRRRLGAWRGTEEVLKCPRLGWPLNWTVGWRARKRAAAPSRRSRGVLPVLGQSLRLLARLQGRPARTRV